MKELRKNSEKIKSLLKDQNLYIRELSSNELDVLENKWMSNFHTAHSDDSFKWHVFSFNIVTHFEGQEAINCLKQQRATSVFVTNEKFEFGFELTKNDDFILSIITSMKDDIYFIHPNQRWTFVCTHEHPDFGPYFKIRER